MFGLLSLTTHLVLDILIALQYARGVYYCLADPILAYKANNFINNLQWSSAQPDWVFVHQVIGKYQVCWLQVAIVFKRSVQILRV